MIRDSSGATIAIVRKSSACLVSVVVFVSTAASAQPTDPTVVAARQKYNAGSAAFTAGKYEDAAASFEAAGGAVPSAVAFCNAARAWEKAVKPVRAADAYARCLVSPKLSKDQESDAKEKLALLEVLLGKVEVAAPQGYRARLDDHTDFLAPATLYGTPGQHTLTVTSPDKTEARDVTLEQGKPAIVEIQPPPPPMPETKPPPVEERPAPPAPPPPPPPPPPPSLDARRAVGFGVLGLGVATLGAGAVLGLQANDAGDAYNARPSQEALDHANGLQTWTNVALVAGGVLTAGGLALVLWPSPKQEAHAGSSRETPLPAPPKNDDVPPGDKAGARVIVAPVPGGIVVRGVL